MYFKMDPDNFDYYGGVDHALYCFEHYTSSETCLSAFKAPLDPSTALGGFPGSNYSEASAFVVTYPVNNAVNEAGNENGKAEAREKAFIKLVKVELFRGDQRRLRIVVDSENEVDLTVHSSDLRDLIVLIIRGLAQWFNSTSLNSLLKVEP